MTRLQLIDEWVDLRGPAGATLVASAIAAASLLGPVTLARAERAPSRRERTMIRSALAFPRRALHVRTASIKVSTSGPYALVLTAGSQPGALVLKRVHSHWRDIDNLRDEGLPCGLVPARVIDDLHLERYNEGPRPCLRR